MPERLAAVAVAVADAADALKLARKQRDQLVRESVDDGHLSQRATATAAGITVPRVSAILAAQDDDDE
jgi:predicted XRE-type DNA-binding protein